MLQSITSPRFADTLASYLLLAQDTIGWASPTRDLIAEVSEQQILDLIRILIGALQQDLDVIVGGGQ